MPVANVPFDASNREVCPRLIVRRISDHVQQTYSLASYPTCQTEPTEYWNLPVLRDANLPREEKQERGGLQCAPDTEFEDSGVLQEELAFFRKEQRKSRQVDLLIVDFHLREVGVHGHIQDQSRSYFVLGIDPNLQARIKVDVVAFLLLRGTNQQIRLRLDIEPGTREVGEVLQVACSAYPVESFGRPRPAAPQHFLILAANDPINIKSP